LALYYPRECNVDLIGYADADYAGFLVDRKNISGMAHFLRPYVVSWATKKQQSAAMSIAEAEYVIATSCCAQLLMLTMQASWLIEKAPQVWLIFLDHVWYIGQPRNNTLLPCPQQKLNIL